MPITNISTVLHFIGGQNILQEVANIQATLTDNIYDKDDIDGLLETKAEANSIYDKSTIDGLLQAKADINSVYDKGAIDGLLTAKADANSVYNKTTINGLLEAKADADSVYDKNAIDVLLDDKIDKDISSLTIGDLTINSNSISKKVTNNTTTTTSNVLFDDDLSFTKQSGSDEIATISYKNTTYSILKEKYINSASVVNVIKQENDYYENTVSTDNKIGNGLVSNVGQYIKLTFNTDNSDIIYINVDSIGAEYSPSSTQTDVNINIDQTAHTIGASLTATGVISGDYGSVTGNAISMPAFTVDSTGRITSAESKSFNLPTLSSLGAISTITATGTAPLTLQAELTDTSYTITGDIADASNDAKGVVKVGDNISVNDGTISLSKENVTSALGYTPYNQDDLAGTLGKYKTKQTAVASPTTTSSSDTTAFIDSISQDTNGVISVTKSNVQFPDYSSTYKSLQTTVSTPNAEGNATAFIDSISQDAQGKIAISKKNVSFPDYSSTYKSLQSAVSTPNASGNATAFIDTISQDAQGKITISKKNVNFPDYSDTYQEKGNYKLIQSEVKSPTASGNATAFIDTIAQDANGKITVTKKNVNLSSKMDKANPTGTGYLSLNAAATPGSYSVAAGYSTTASGIAATALGSTATASADYALATGYGTLASGGAATATGRSTTAKAANSFASGLGTIAAAPNQAVFGQYNKEDADALFVVGNGSGGEASQRVNIMWLTSQGYLHATKVYGSVWNDYAEYRQTHHKVRPGQCVYEKGDGSLAISYERMMPGANIVSDTFGFAIGETDECKTPLAVSGRVLAYPYESKETYNPGDAVCSGPNGTISKMTRAEIRDYPERIVGTVSEIPTYEVWGSGNIKVNGRIWIKVR